MNAKVLLVSFCLFTCWALPCLANTACEDASMGERRPGKCGAMGTPRTCDLANIAEQVRELQEFQNAVKMSAGICYVGISTGTINLSQLSASSVHSTCPFRDVTLNSGGAWCTAANNQNQWVQIDLLVPRKITGVVTRGRGNLDQWVTTYRVSYGNDLTQMTYYAESHEAKVFHGNSDRNTVVENMFNVPISARYIRIHPVGYHGHMSMRIELRQC